ncbi:MAG: hypothetical protein WAV31_02895 [Candidatus Moraniibacteriota bacterium]
MKKYKIKRESLDIARKIYIEKIIKNLEENKFTSDIDNLMQSFVYLILNDKFHRNIKRLRKSQNIAPSGFLSDEKYQKWKSKNKLDALYLATTDFIEKNNLSYKRLRPIVTEMIKDYILGKDFIPQTHYSLINKRFSYHSFIGGFDVPDPKIIKDDAKNFYKIFWEVYIQPTDNLSQFKKSLKKYFVWFMDFNFKDGVFEFDVKVNMKKTAELLITTNDSNLILQFISYSNTKTREIEKLFKQNKKKISELHKKIKKLQKEHKALNFSRKIKHYLCYLDGLSPSKAEWQLYRKMKTPEERRNPRFAKRISEIKTNYNEVRISVSEAFKSRLSL